MKEIERDMFRTLKISAVLFLILTPFFLLFYPAAATPMPNEKAGRTILADGDFTPYEPESKVFRVQIPGQWQKSEKGHPYGDLTKITGVKLTGPKNKDGAAITLSVLYYSGDGIFPNDKAFIAGTLNSIARTDYDKQTVIADTTIAGRPAKTFQIKTRQLIYLPMKDRPTMREGIVYELAPPSIQVGMIQEYIVIPAKTGFFVLHYGAPEDIAAEYHVVFEKVIDSFRPLLP